VGGITATERRYYRIAPPQLEPAPAVQPKQWLPVNSRGRTQQSDRDSDSGTLDD